MTTIKQCSCASEFQDKTFGNKMRVHNMSADNKDGVCTICGNKKRL